MGHPLLAGELLDELRVEHLLAEQRVGGAGRFLRSAHVFVWTEEIVYNTSVLMIKNSPNIFCSS